MSVEQQCAEVLFDRLTDIYVITNCVNGKQYVGKANQYHQSGKKHGARRRFFDHLSEAENGYTNCAYLNNAIRKYGRANFGFETVAVVPTAEQDRWECQYIKTYNTYEGRGYNLTPGGQPGFVSATEDARQLTSDRQRKYGSDLPMYIQEVHRISGQTGYAVCLPGTRKTKSFTSGTLTMEQKLQLATAWKAAAASDPVASRTTPKQLPPFIQHLSKSQSRPGLQALYKVSRPGQTLQILFCKSFTSGTFEEQLKAAKICLYDQIQKGVIKPGRAACTKLGLPGE